MVDFHSYHRSENTENLPKEDGVFLKRHGVRSHLRTAGCCVRGRSQQANPQTKTYKNRSGDSRQCTRCTYFPLHESAKRFRVWVAILSPALSSITSAPFHCQSTVCSIISSLSGSVTRSLKCLWQETVLSYRIRKPWLLYKIQSLHSSFKCCRILSHGGCFFTHQFWHWVWFLSMEFISCPGITSFTHKPGPTGDFLMTSGMSKSNQGINLHLQAQK